MLAKIESFEIVMVHPCALEDKFIGPDEVMPPHERSSRTAFASV
jgi:hypothetical protein